MSGNNQKTYFDQDQPICEELPIPFPAEINVGDINFDD